MYSTREVLAALKKANPHSQITEDDIRNAIRRDFIPAPRQFAGRLACTQEDVLRLCRHLNLQPPWGYGDSSSPDHQSLQEAGE